MENIRFELETVTPMFMAGADQGRFELRPPSFKGLLRFWWRAYYWGNQSQKITSKDIEEEEGKIFGTTSNNGNKSRFSIRIRNQHSHPSSYRFSKEQKFLLKYLSYGTQYQPHDASGEIVLSISDPKHEKEIITSMYLLTTCGALGAKSRNGFGNIAVKESQLFQDYNLPFPFPTPEFLNTLVINDNMPNFTAFSKHIKIFKLKQTCKTPETCHEQIGQIYKECKTSLDKPLSCQKRQYLAAPITVQQRVGGRWKVYESSFLERHAKPYFLKIVKTHQGYDGYMLYLPSTYCEGLEKDRQGKRINQKEASKLFHECCGEMNDYLAERMEVYYG